MKDNKEVTKKPKKGLTVRGKTREEEEKFPECKECPHCHSKDYKVVHSNVSCYRKQCENKKCQRLFDLDLQAYYGHDPYRTYHP